MKVKLNKAVKMFFGNSSLEMVYSEAIANSLDANATEIDINIKIAAFNKPDTLQIEIIDNGDGFTDERYRKFSNLFDVNESSHKGLGRLVYLCYFQKVSISSVFDNRLKRTFNFDENFEEEAYQIEEVENTNSGTSILMRDYSWSKVKQYSYLKPSDIKKRILEEFYSRLFLMKQENQELTIKINLQADNVNLIETLTLDDVPHLEMVQIQSSTTLFDELHLYYSIEVVDSGKESFIAALSIDNRTVKMDIVAKENEPLGYKMTFLLFSDLFEGKVDLARQNLTIPDNELRDIQQAFRNKVVELIEDNVPRIAKRNKESQESLNNHFPHLTGYFDTKNIGYISRDEIIKKAQSKFFGAQKEVLDAGGPLTDEQYQKSLELSSRALIEYVLFRQVTINKLKNTDSNDSEITLHNLFCQRFKKFSKETASEDIYQNNAWLLDDKYMSYETVFSEKDMKELVSHITEGEVDKKDDGRPDIALVFSDDPNKDCPFDVVIVELKKRGVSHYDNAKAIQQLTLRARRLMKFYGNKIQRIWFYAIIEMDKETELDLKGEYTELYSSGKMYYREHRVAVEDAVEGLIKLPIGVYVWDIDALINDADKRNSTFLNLIKSKFTQCVQTKK